MKDETYSTELRCLSVVLPCDILFQVSFTVDKLTLTYHNTGVIDIMVFFHTTQVTEHSISSTIRILPDLRLSEWLRYCKQFFFALDLNLQTYNIPCILI